MKDKKLFSQEIIYFIIVTLFWFAQYVYIPYQAVYLNYNGVSDYFLGIIIGAYGISQMLLRFPVGLFADCVGSHKKFIMVGCLASGIASIFRILLSNGVGFLIGNVLSGVASAMWISFMIFYLDKHRDKSSQNITSKIVMFNNLGMLLGFIISMLFYSVINMKGICLLSFIGGIGAFVFSLFLYEIPKNSSCNNLKELAKVCQDKRLIFFSLLALIQQGIQLTTVMSFTNNILRDLGATNLIVGFSSVIYMCSAVLFSAFASSEFCRKKSVEFWIVLTFVVTAFYTIAIPNVDKIELILLLQILPGISTGILFSYLTSEALKNISSLKKSTAMGFFQGIYAIGMTTFPVVIGKITNLYNIKIGYYFLSFIALLGAIISFYYYQVANKKIGKKLLKLKSKNKNT